jgi:hypothetical protein
LSKSRQVSVYKLCRSDVDMILVRHYKEKLYSLLLDTAVQTRYQWNAARKMNPIARFEVHGHDAQ